MSVYPEFQRFKAQTKLLFLYYKPHLNKNFQIKNINKNCVTVPDEIS